MSENSGLIKFERTFSTEGGTTIGAESETTKRRRSSEYSESNRSFYKKFTRILVAQVVIFVGFLSYLLLGAVIYQLIDEQLARRPLSDVVLFCFTTLATIGYGNIYPTNDASRVFTICFAIFGIPLCMLTIANFGKYFTRLHWIIMHYLRTHKLVRDSRSVSHDDRLPMLFLTFAFISTLFVTVLLFQKEGEHQRWITVDDIYFSVISFTTVGFGDKFTEALDFGQLLRFFAYLMWGTMIFSVFFTTIRHRLMSIYLNGKRVTKASKWANDKTLQAIDLLSTTSKLLDYPHKIHMTIHDFDCLSPTALEPNASNMERFDVI